MLLHVAHDSARLRLHHWTRGSIGQLHTARIVATGVLALVRGAVCFAVVLPSRMCGLETVRAQGRPRLSAASGVLGWSGHGLLVLGGVPGSDVGAQLLHVWEGRAAPGSEAGPEGSGHRGRAAVEVVV